MQAGPRQSRVDCSQFLIVCSGRSAQDLVTTALQEGPLVQLTCVQANGDFRRIAFDLHGQVTVTRRQTGSSWSQDGTDLEQILTDLAPVLEQGLIRRSSTWDGVWYSTVNNTLLPAPFGGEGLHLGDRLTYLRHLLGRHTLDAYGVQVLTDEHLANAHNLSHWDVQTVAPGRHLVQTRHLDAWYADEQPDAQTLAQARTDFGDLILNPRVVAAESAQRP